MGDLCDANEILLSRRGHDANLVTEAERDAGDLSRHTYMLKTICAQDLSAHCDTHRRIFSESPYAQSAKMTHFGHFGYCARIVRDKFSFNSRIDRKRK